MNDSGPGPLKSGDASAADIGRRFALGVLGATALASLGVIGWALWPEGEPPPQRLGPRAVMPPPIRARVGRDDLVFLLTRRAEQNATDPVGAAARRERIDLMALDVATLATRFEVHLISVPRGAMRDAVLIAAQGATIWVWLNGIGALSAVDGRVLADQGGLEDLNPGVPVGMPATRSAWRVADALVLDIAPGMPSWRFDPRDFRASLAGAAPPRPLPAPYGAAPVAPRDPAAFRVNEARLGEEWFGLPAESATLAAPMALGGGGRFLPPEAPAGGVAQALWRGSTRRPASGVERLVELAPVPELRGLHAAGFLTAGGPGALTAADPAGLVLLHGGAGDELTLQRLSAEGRALWRAALPIGAVRSVLTGPGHLLLLDGMGERDLTDARLVSVALADGAVTDRRLSA